MKKFVLFLLFSLFPFFVDATTYCISNVSGSYLYDSFGGIIATGGAGGAPVYITTTGCPGGASTLNDLTDVTISSAVQGQVLMKGSGDWINAATSSATSSGGTIINNSTTTLSTVDDVQHLFYGIVLFVAAYFMVLAVFRRV